MAGNKETTPDAEAKKWFTLAMIGTVLYVSAVFFFVLSQKVGNEAAAAEAAEAAHGAEVQEHGQSH
jgi:hypothetical protein